MREITFKIGTRAEVIEYVRKKVSKTVTITPNSFGTPSIWSQHPEDGEIFEFSHNTIENQFDTYIREGCPIVGISLPGNHCKGYTDTFIISDCSSIRADMEIEKMDNPEIRKRRIEAIRHVMAMELDAEERWNRILKIVDEFNGVSIPFKPNTIL